MTNQRGAGIELEVVGKGRSRRDFLALPAAIYASDPAWIAPLNFLKREQISPKNHFFDHAKFRAWVAHRGGRVVGRISAQVDELHLAQHGDDAGYFGLLEAEDDPEVFAALFEAAEGWLREQGMRVARGPFNLNINEEVGLLVDGFDYPTP